MIATSCQVGNEARWGRAPQSWMHGNATAPRLRMVSRAMELRRCIWASPQPEERCREPPMQPSPLSRPARSADLWLSGGGCYKLQIWGSVVALLHPSIVARWLLHQDEVFGPGATLVDPAAPHSRLLFIAEGQVGGPAMTRDAMCMHTMLTTCARQVAWRGSSGKLRCVTSSARQRSARAAKT
jgi:hypothetical protein